MFKPFLDNVPKNYRATISSLMRETGRLKPFVDELCYRYDSAVKSQNLDRVEAYGSILDLCANNIDSLQEILTWCCDNTVPSKALQEAATTKQRNFINSLKERLSYDFKLPPNLTKGEASEIIFNLKQELKQKQQ